jgi:hypothetical protein
VLGQRGTEEGGGGGGEELFREGCNRHDGAHALVGMARKEGMTYAQIANEKGFRTLRRASDTATHAFRMIQKYGAMLVL